MGADRQESSFPLTDLDLARRLERTEGNANAAFVETRAQLDPQTGAAWTEIAGVYAMFDGASSPLTQTFGLDLFEPADDTVLERLESFFLERDAPVIHEVCPLADPALLSRLNRRGYQPVEHSSVLVRPTDLSLRPASSPIRVRLVDPEEAGLWSRVASQGWGSESTEVADFIEQFGQVTVRSRGIFSFLAELDGQPIATASLCVGEGVALLAGASTIPAGRRQGAQRALLEARLQFAAELGIGLAMMVANPGSESQRNAERQGFRVVYTRLKWQLNRQSV
jgi:GNAT superfamily N-acetyltransferase